MSRTIFAVLITVLLMGHGGISGATKIMLKNGEAFPSGEILAIQGETVVVKTKFGNLQAKLSDISTILFDEQGDPSKPGVQFANGDRLTGVTVESYRNNTLTLKTRYGVYVASKAGAVTSINLENNDDPVSYDEPWSGMVHLILNRYERLVGQVLAVDAGLLIFKTRYGQLQIKEMEIEQFFFPGGFFKSMSAKEAPGILFQNGDRVSGMLVNLKGDRALIETPYGQFVIDKPVALLRVTVGLNSLATEELAKILKWPERMAVSKSLKETAVALFEKAAQGPKGDRDTYERALIEEYNMLVQKARSIMKTDPFIQALKELQWRGNRDAAAAMVAELAKGLGVYLTDFVTSEAFKTSAASLAKRAAQGPKGDRDTYERALIEEYNMLVQEVKTVYKEQPFTQALKELQWRGNRDAAAGAVARLAKELENAMAGFYTE